MSAPVVFPRPQALLGTARSAQFRFAGVGSRYCLLKPSLLTSSSTRGTVENEAERPAMRLFCVDIAGQTLGLLTSAARRGGQALGSFKERQNAAAFDRHRGFDRRSC